MHGVGEGEAVLYIKALVCFSRDSLFADTLLCDGSETLFRLFSLNLLCFKARQELPVLKSSTLLLLEQRVLEVDT